MVGVSSMTVFSRTRRAAAAVAFLILVATPATLLGDFAVFRAPSHIVSVFTLPGEPVEFDLATYAGTRTSQLGRFEVSGSDEVEVELTPGGKFLLVPPREVGIYPVRFQEVVAKGVPSPLPYRVQLVVLRPASEVIDGELNGYPIGGFPRENGDERWRFEPPRGFVEITAENRNTLLSDHFTLGDLDCKLDTEYPHYASIKTSLLVKLEGLTDVLNQRGLDGDYLRVMSGFRTPDYNRSIGNRTTFSRHVAGDAADVYVDRNGDETMDDLNGDGRINYRDALFLFRIVESLDESSDYGALVGGAAAYRPNQAHGPFVHVDTRGYAARW